MDGIESETRGTHRDLGLIVDSSLKFHHHIDSVVSGASRMANQLLRATVCREKDLMLPLFISHIRPIIDYCSSVWNLGYRGDVRKLESIQRRWTREILGLGGLVYEDRLKELGLYSIQGRLLRADIIKVWKIFHPEVDIGLDRIFDRRSHGATRGHSLKLAVPRSRSETKRRFLNSRVVTVWNGLPAEVVSASTLASFKGRLDGHMSGEFCRVTI